MTMPKLCVVSDCCKPAPYGRHCSMHSARLKRGGTLERRQPKKSLSELLGGKTQFKAWTVIGEGEPYRRPSSDGKPHPGGIQRTALCRCECGNERTIPVHVLKRGMSGQCGCKTGAIIATQKTIHGLARSPEHRTWSHMKERCSNPNNQDWLLYGGRGITVCQRWQDSFEAFYADMGPRPERTSIDRIDVNGNYEPGNCRWADAVTQRHNQRRGCSERAVLDLESEF